MSDDPSATIIYGFQFTPDEDGRIGRFDDHWSITDSYHKFLVQNSELGDEPDRASEPGSWRSRSESWRTWRSRADELISRAPELTNFGSDAGEDLFVVGVQVLRTDWDDGALALDVEKLTGCERYQPSIEAFCEWCGITALSSELLILCEIC